MGSVFLCEKQIKVLHQHPFHGHPYAFWQHFLGIFNEKPVFLLHEFHSPFFGSYKSPVAV
jgi:hypothetical protein